MLSCNSCTENILKVVLLNKIHILELEMKRWHALKLHYGMHLESLMDYYTSWEQPSTAYISEPFI